MKRNGNARRQALGGDFFSVTKEGVQYHSAQDAVAFGHVPHLLQWLMGRLWLGFPWLPMPSRSAGPVCHSSISLWRCLWSPIPVVQSAALFFPAWVFMVWPQLDPYGLPLHWPCQPYFVRWLLGPLMVRLPIHSCSCPLAYRLAHTRTHIEFHT